ncbi:MAG: hypothetical protein RLY31_3090 [Bacteroidota bacterium]|jgi:hypothetical protein
MFITFLAVGSGPSGTGRHDGKDLAGRPLLPHNVYLDWETDRGMKAKK